MQRESRAEAELGSKSPPPLPRPFPRNPPPIPSPLIRVKAPRARNPSGDPFPSKHADQFKDDPQSYPAQKGERKKLSTLPATWNSTHGDH